MLRSDNYDARLREMLMTLEGARVVAQDFIERAASEIALESGVETADFFKKIVVDLADRNLSRIYTDAESPIEIVFAATLQLHYLYYNPFGLRIYPPLFDGLRDLARARESHQNLLAWLEGYRQSGLEWGNWNEFETWLGGLERSAGVPIPDKGELLLAGFFTQVALSAQHWISLQSCFPSLGIDGRSLRVDLVAFSPSDNTAPIIGECDGYEYHSAKDAFVRDRQRDRLLQGNGFRVMRFSGSEIYRHPVTVSIDLFKALNPNAI